MRVLGVVPLALAALSSASPISSTASGAAIAVCFAPEEDCAAFAVRAINNAEREIPVGAYALTTGSGIVGALVRAKERGVDVRLIADKTTPCERESGIEPFAAAGVSIWIDVQARIAHAQTMVFDSAVTLTGSMNWTRGAAVNSEYERNYDRERWEHCERLGDRERELRDRLAYAPPYSEERGRLGHRLREVHYEREQCWHH